MRPQNASQEMAALASTAHSAHYSFSCGHPAAAPGSSEEEGKGGKGTGEAVVWVGGGGV